MDVASNLVFSVIRGLDPRSHLSAHGDFAKEMDCRVKPGNDE